MSKQNLSDKEKEVISEKKTVVKHSFVGFWIVLAFLVIIAVAAAFFIPMKTISRIENVPYQVVEEYTVQEPYNDTKSSAVPGYKMPEYGIEVYYKTIENSKAVVGCNIINKEDVSVRYRYYIYTTDKNETNTPEGSTYFSQSTVPEYVTIEGYGSLHKNATLPAKEFFGCYVLPDLVKTAFPTVKYENIIKYRDVKKTREITKYRTETIYTQVNYWIPEIKMPWHKEWRE